MKKPFIPQRPKRLLWILKKLISKFCDVGPYEWFTGVLDSEKVIKGAATHLLNAFVIVSRWALTGKDKFIFLICETFLAGLFP